MSWLARVVFLYIVAISAVAQSKSEMNLSPVDQKHTAWIADAIKAIETVKVGMTRSDLTKVLTTEGGLSTTSLRTYVYRRCPYIKVDLKFALQQKRRASDGQNR